MKSRDALALGGSAVTSSATAVMMLLTPQGVLGDQNQCCTTPGANFGCEYYNPSVNEYVCVPATQCIDDSRCVHNVVQNSCYWVAGCSS